MYFASVPSLSMPRVMLSSQMLWPRSCSFWVGFIDSLRGGGRLQGGKEGVGLHAREFADVIQRDLGGRIFLERGRIVGVMALTHEHRGQAVAPLAFHAVQHAQLVFDHHVMSGGKPLRHIVQHALLVHIDQDPALHRIGDARDADLARLQHHVAVGQHHAGAESCEVRNRVQRTRIYARGEVVFQQVGRQILRAQFVIAFQPEALNRAEVVGVTQLFAQVFVDLPVLFRGVRAEHVRDVLVEIILHAVVVEQGVVDVEQEHDGCGLTHRITLAGESSCGSFQPPASAISASASFGPQVPGLYFRTGTLSPMTGSSTRQASSTQSSRVNSAESPSIASPSRRSYGAIAVRTWRCAISSTGSPRMASPGSFTSAPSEMITSGLKRKRKWFTAPFVGQSKTCCGGFFRRTSTSVHFTGSCLPARMRNGTPDHRHVSMWMRSAANVSTVESFATPGSSK